MNQAAIDNVRLKRRSILPPEVEAAIGHELTRQINAGYPGLDVGLMALEIIKACHKVGLEPVNPAYAGKEASYGELRADEQPDLDPGMEATAMPEAGSTIYRILVEQSEPSKDGGTVTIVNEYTRLAKYRWEPLKWLLYTGAISETGAGAYSITVVPGGEA